MKLLRLKITDPKGFRSLQNGFEVDFLREWDFGEARDFNPYILAGPNGSGKSNVLEALAAIFYHIECVYLNYRPKSFEYDKEDNPGGFQSEIASPNGFELEYFIPPPPEFNKTETPDFASIKIVKECNKPPEVLWQNRELFDAASDKKLSRIEVKKILPEFVLGYSSGENEILSLPFFKMRFIYFDEYEDYIKREDSYSSVPEGRLMFLSSEFNQAIVLSNLLLQDKGSLKPFKDEVGVEDVKQFRIVIKKYIKLDKEQVSIFPGSVIETYEDESGEKKSRIDITQNLKTTIEKLRKCSTCCYDDKASGMLYLDYWINDETKKAFGLYFDSAIELFQEFQILLTLNLYTVNETLKKEIYRSTSLYANDIVPILQSNERVLYFDDLLIKKSGVNENLPIKSLSDGEHQFLHSLGLCLLYKDKQCLFLLDEPETHFNPDWRAKFISRLRDCFKDGKAKSVMREMLITTHTPFLISDSKNEYVLVFKNNPDKKIVEVNRPDYNTLGASINKITMKTFGKKETISGYAEQLLKKFEERFEAGESEQNIIDEVNKLLGDSVEKVLFINKLLDRMENE